MKDDIKKENLEILESSECNNAPRDILTENITIEEENSLPCNCNDTMTDELGPCKARDSRFQGKFSCMVNVPSLCTDLISVSPTIQFSAAACEDKNEGMLSFYLISKNIHYKAKYY